MFEIIVFDNYLYEDAWWSVLDDYGEDHTLWEKGVQWKGGPAFGCWDKLSIRLDLKRQQIKYSINNGKESVAFRNIAKCNGMKYRLTVSVHKQCGVVEIVYFTEKCIEKFFL